MRLTRPRPDRRPHSRPGPDHAVQASRLREGPWPDNGDAPDPVRGDGALGDGATPAGRLSAVTIVGDRAATAGAAGGRDQTPRRPSTLRVAGRVALALAAVVLLVAVSGGPAHAATVQVLALAGSVGTVLDNVRNWIMGILAGVATVFLTIGGLRYVMAGGDPGEVQKAKIAFKSAGIGYGLAALAPLVVTVLKGIVGA